MLSNKFVKKPIYDNILSSGISSWKTPYRFVILKHLIWDATVNEIVDVLNSPAEAYTYWEYYQDLLQGTVNQYTYKYMILDSFNKDAFTFCKEASEKENNYEGTTVEVKT